MVFFQLVCLVLLPLAYWVQARLNPETMKAAPIIFLAAWLGEATSVHFYGFYSYSPDWWFRVAGVPLLVPVIWPLVILSSREVVRSLWPNLVRYDPLLVGAFVFVDASLIEVVAVRCGLWAWTESGYLGVPLIGVLGWAYFAAAVTWLLQSLKGRRRWWILATAPAVLHVLLVSSWWVVFRWIWRGDWFVQFVVVVALLTLAAWRVRDRRRMSMRVAWVRLLAAGVFVGLLLFAAPTAGRVWLHVLLVSIPYATATDFHK